MRPPSFPSNPSDAPMLTLRPACVDDVPDVLALNEANVEMLAPMDEARFHELRRLAHRFDVAEADGAFAGFVITFAPGSAYDSENYRWFSDRHVPRGQGFYYLDRFVLLPGHRRRGLGSRVYDEVESAASAYGRMCLEVNLVPRNDASLAFHERRGYVDVGRLGDAEHLVSLMEKRL